jgi:hypothetical protein
MATIDPQMQAMFEAFANAMRGASTSMFGFQQSLKNAARETDQASRQIAASRAIGSQLDALSEQFSNLGKRSAGITQTFDQLRRATDDLAIGVDRNSKLMRINQLQLKAATTTFREFFKDTIGGQAVEGVKTFIRNLQTGTDPIAIANQLNTSIALITGGLAKGLGDFLQSAAGGIAGKLSLIFAKFPKIGPMISGLAEGLTNALGGVTKTIGGALQFAVEILSTELDKTNKAFDTITSSGALFANGMTGMRKAAGDARLTLTAFAETVKQNAESLANTGLGVTGGAARMGQAIKAGGDEMRMRLQNLGFDISEHGGLVAEVMADMRQAGEAMLAPQDVAQATQKYAENLRILSGITGEDAKQRMGAARQAANQLAFQQKLAGMEEKQRQATIAAMANMSEIQRKNFMDTVLFGSVINKEGATAEALSSGLSDSVKAIVESFRQGQLSPEEVRKINTTYGETIKEQALAQGASIGLAAAAGVGGIASSLAELFSKEIAERIKFTPAAISAAESAASALANTEDSLTTSANKTKMAVTDLQIQIERVLTPSLTVYSRITEVINTKLLAMTETIEDFIITMMSSKEGGANIPTELRRREITAADIDKRARQHAEKAKLDFDKMSAEAQDAARVRAQQELALEESSRRKQAATRIQLQQEADAEYQRKLQSGEIIVDPNEREFAIGGIAAGPKSGYRARLHGIEAVVPLPNGREIPVEVKESSTSSVAASMDLSLLIETVKEQTNKFENLLASNSEILRVLQQSRDLARDLRDNYA